jgi:hypothetical protein
VIGKVNHALGSYRDLVPSPGKAVREVENVPFLTAYIRGKKLSE